MKELNEQLVPLLQPHYTAIQAMQVIYQDTLQHLPEPHKTTIKTDLDRKVELVDTMLAPYNEVRRALHILSEQR